MRDKILKASILFFIPLLLYAGTLPFAPLMEPDEGRYSLIPSAMNATGDYVTPRLKGVVYFEKPPLAYWATALSFRFFGENEFSARLFAALCAWGCILLAYRMGVFFHDRRTGLYAAAVLTTFLYHAIFGRINILDIPLTLFVCLSIWMGFSHLVSGDGSNKKLPLCYAFSALAFMTKGLIGIVFPFGILTLWLALSARWRDILKLVSPIGIALFAVIVMPWLYFVQQENQDFFRFFFIQEHLLRYTTKMHDHYEPFFYYVPIVVAGTLPWCAFIPEAIHGIRGKLTLIFGETEKKLGLVWISTILIFFSVSSSKLVPYIAPIFVPTALWLGHLFRRYEEDWAMARTSIPFACRIAVILQGIIFTAVLFLPLFPHNHQIDPEIWWPWMVFPLIFQILILFVPDMIRSRWGKGWFLSIYVLFSLFLGAITFPVIQYLTPYKSAWPLSQAVKTHLPAGSTLYQYGISLYGVDFYTGMRTPIVDDIGELRYGSEKLSAEERERYFYSSASFLALARTKENVYCATKGKERMAILKKEFPTLMLLWHNDVYYLMKLK